MTAALLAAGGSLLGGTSSLVGGKKGAQAATQAASIQAAAAMQGAQLQQQRFEEAKAVLQPYVQYGQTFMGPLQNLMGLGPGGGGPLGSILGQQPGVWQPTMQQLAQMPGYQFQRQQGMMATQSGQAAQGLGRSGSALMAGGQYGSGLAAANWPANFNQWLQQQNLMLSGHQQLYNMLAAPIGTGLSAAGATAGVGIQSGQQIANSLAAAGAAQAGGVTSAAQQLIGGGQAAAANFAAAPYSYLMANQLAAMSNPLSGGAGDVLVPGVGGAYASNIQLPA